MGFFATLGNAMFGSAKKQNAQADVSTLDVMSMSGSSLENKAQSQIFDYHFNPRPINRTPGPAYISPLLQFQEYPRNVVEGWGGIAYKRGFQAYQPNSATTANTPVPSGTSGITHGQVFYQPLADTSGNQTMG